MSQVNSASQIRKTSDTHIGFCSYGHDDSTTDESGDKSVVRFVGNPVADTTSKGPASSMKETETDLATSQGSCDDAEPEFAFEASADYESDPEFAFEVPIDYDSDPEPIDQLDLQPRTMPKKSTMEHKPKTNVAANVARKIKSHPNGEVKAARKAAKNAKLDPQGKGKAMSKAHARARDAKNMS